MDERQPEPMGEFFDRRAEGYDEHMRRSVESFDAFYDAVADAVDATDAPVRILDLGVGTGLEVERILERAPNAQVTGVDLSTGMLTRLKRKLATRLSQIRLVHDSFLGFEFGDAVYDAVVSVMALHHWLPDVKRQLYRRIYVALRPGGRFVNGDYIVDADTLRRMKGTSFRIVAPSGHDGDTPHHIDIPLPFEVESALLRDVGFTEITVPFATTTACVLVATKPAA